MEAAHTRAQKALDAVAGVADGLSLSATRRLGAAALAAAALPPEQQLAAVVQLAAASPAEEVSHAAYAAGSSQQHRQWVLAATAVEVLLSGHSPPTAGQAAGILQHQVLPLLVAGAEAPAVPPSTAAAVPQQQHEELLAAAAQLVAACSCWGLGLELVRAAVGNSSSAPGSSGDPAAAAGMAGQLQPYTRVRLAAAVIRQGLQAASRHEDQLPPELGALLQHAATYTLAGVLALLAAEPPVSRRQRSNGGRAPAPQLAAGAARAAAAQLLLPAALQAAAQQQGQPAAMEQLWEACRQMLAGSRQQRQQGLALLVQFAALLLTAATAASAESSSQQPPQQPPQQPWRSVQEQGAFWELLRGCLCDSEASTRKRAAHLLRLALQAQQPDGQLPPVWQPLLKLLDCLEELAPHLVKDAWGEIDRLHPPASVPASGEGSTGGSGTDAGSLEWQWMEVVWSRGLGHEHQQVQRMVLSSFLGRCWDPARLVNVPPVFVLHMMLPAAGQARLWRGEGAAELQQGVAAWVGSYAAALPLRERRQLLLALLSCLADGSAGGSNAQAQQRPLVQTVVAALEAAASTQCQAGAAGAGAAAGSQEEERQWQLLLLHQLQDTTRQLSTAWGAGGPTGSFAARVCGSLLHLAASTGPLLPDSSGSRDAAVSAAATWLQQLYLPLLLPGGPLHSQAVGWLGSLGRQHLLPALTSCTEQYMGQGGSSSSSSGGGGSSGSSGISSEAGQASWQQQADGLARLGVLLACSDGQASSTAALSGADLAAAFGSWETTLNSLYRRPYLQPGSAERCLLLLNELLSAAQLLKAGDQQGQQQHPVLDWLTALISSCADELASYASMAAAPLWQGHQLQQQRAGEEAGRQQGAPAQLALACACNSLQLLVQLDCGAGPAAERLVACCLGALQGYAASTAAPGAAHQPMGSQTDSSGWQRAAASLQPLAGCCAALAAAAEAGWLSAPEQQLTLQAAAEAAAVALTSVLSLQAAAAESTTAGGSSKQASSLAAYCHRLCWKAVVSLLQLLQQLQAAGPSPAQQQQQQWEEQQAAALAAALNGLQRASGAPALAADYRGLLLQLRCCRLLLPATLQQQTGVAQLALAKRQTGADPAAIGQTSSKPGLVLAAWVCSAAWQGYEAAAAAAKRRRAGLTAALVSTCLHPTLFSTSGSDGGSPAEVAPTALELHGPGGPIQQLLARLLDLGSKSWRTMSIVSLQLCGLLARHPELAAPYSAPLQTLLLWGAADDPGQSGVGDPVDAEAAAELAALIAPGDAGLATAFASSALAPRVAALCLLHSWVQHVQQAEQAGTQQPAAEEQSTAVAAGEAGRHLWRQLLQLALNDPELGATRYSALGITHRKKVRLWQALCVLSPLVPTHEAEAVLDSLLSLMAATADAANVRQYQDVIALVLLRLRPDLLRSRVLPPLADCASSGSHALSSLILVAARAAVAQVAPAGPAGGGGERQQQEQQQEAPQQQLREEQRALLMEVVAAVAPWALCHVHALRTFAQLVLWRLFELFPSLPASDATAGALLRFFRENDDVNRLRRGLAHAFCFDAFQLDLAVAPAAVLGQEGSAQRGEAAFEGAPQPLLEVVQGFLAIERQALRQDMRQREAATAVAELGPATQQQQPRGAQGSGSNWQKKGGGAAMAGPAAAGPWADALGAAALLAAAGGSSGLDGTELELGAAEEAAAAARGGPRQELVVVASLLTKAPNLAGLARTCEVFRASSLVLGDLAVTRQKEFTSIAVTAHHWVPLQEVPEAALAPWLRRQAAEGWTLVGLEQTAESVPLQDFSFPRRSVLVLGREKEGIPADILPLLHHTVEIPQLGLIRSLNVHVSGAIGMYEYTRQALQAAQGGTASPQAST